MTSRPATSSPPPVPRLPQKRRKAFLILFCVVGALSLPLLRAFDILIPFAVPTASMKPAIGPGDHILMQGLTYHFHAPRRGDIAVFLTDGLALTAPHDKYLKRIVGVPGDHVQIIGTNLLINGSVTTFSNAVGKIVYTQPQGNDPALAMVDTMVPDESYFVLGDNSTDSLDSRYFGCVPGGNIIGRVWFCYWPLTRIGRVP